MKNHVKAVRYTFRGILLDSSLQATILSYSATSKYIYVCALQKYEVGTTVALVKSERWDICCVLHFDTLKTRVAFRPEANVNGLVKERVREK
jgi:hypothetical protein